MERNDDSWQKSVLQKQGNQLDVLCRDEDLIQSQLEELEGIVQCIRSMDSALFKGSDALKTQQDVEMPDRRCDDITHSFRELNTLKDQLSVLHLEIQAVEPDKQQRTRMASYWYAVSGAGDICLSLVELSVAERSCACTPSESA